MTGRASQRTGANGFSRSAVLKELEQDRAGRQALWTCSCALVDCETAIIGRERGDWNVGGVVPRCRILTALVRNGMN